MSSGVVGNFLSWERLHGIMVTPYRYRWGGGSAQMNDHLSRVKIHVQAWGYNFGDSEEV